VDRGLARAFLRHPRQRLLRLVKLTERDQRPRQPAERLDMLRLVLQDLREERHGGAVIAGLRRLLGHRQRLVDRRRAATSAAQPLHELLDLAFRQRANEPVDRPAILEGIDRRDRLDAHLLRDLGIVVDVQLDHADRAIGGAHDFSSTGPSCLQGPHHGAQKSTMTGWSNDASTTSAMKLAVVTSLTGAPPPPPPPGPPPIKGSLAIG